MSDARLRATERAHAADPSAWRDLMAELRRAGRLGEARVVALRAWETAKARFDVLCPPVDLRCVGLHGTREERAARLAAMDACLVDLDDALALGRELLHELHHEDGPGRCYCEASALPHARHLGRGGRRGGRRAS